MELNMIAPEMTFDLSIINMQDITGPAKVSKSVSTEEYSSQYLRHHPLHETDFVDISNIMLLDNPVKLTYQYTIVGGDMENPIYNLPEGKSPETYVRPPRISYEEFIKIIDEGVSLLTNEGEWRSIINLSQ